MKINLLLTLLLSSYYLLCQEILTLEKAIEYGLANSHKINIAENDLKIIKNANHIGAAGMLPNIIISSGYNGSINDAELEFNPFLDFGDSMDSDIEATQAKSSNLTSSIALNYRLFNGFSGIYTLRKFKNQKSVSDENLRYTIENEILEIIQQFYDVLNKENIYKTYKKSYDISKDRLNQTKERYNYGSVSKLNLLNAEVNANQDKINMEEARIKLNASKLNMVLLIGIQDTLFTIQHEFSFNQNLKLENLLTLMSYNNSSILMSKLNYAIAMDELKIAKSKFTPTIDFFSSYTYNNRKSETSFISKQKDYGVIAGLNVEIPLFTANIRRKNFQNAKINLDSKNQTLEHIKSTIETALISAYYNYKEGLKNLSLLEKNLNTIEKTAQLNKELYDMGQISNLEYRDSEILLDQAEINYISKLSAMKIQEHIIYQLSGQLEKK